MPTAPQLTSEQRAAALAAAAEVRSLHASTRVELKTGRLSLAQLLARAEVEPRIGSMRMSAVLESLPGYGAARSATLLGELRIPGGRRIRGLGPKQRAALLARIGDAAQSQS